MSGIEPRAMTGSGSRVMSASGPYPMSEVGPRTEDGQGLVRHHTAGSAPGLEAC